MLYITIGIALVHFVDLGIGKRRDMSYLRDLRRGPTLAIGLLFMDSLFPVCQSTRGIRTGLEGRRLEHVVGLIIDARVPRCEGGLEGLFSSSLQSRCLRSPLHVV